VLVEEVVLGEEDWLVTPEEPVLVEVALAEELGFSEVVLARGR
jgi:hypothetical protein